MNNTTSKNHSKSPNQEEFFATYNTSPIRNDIEEEGSLDLDRLGYTFQPNLLNNKTCTPTVSPFKQFPDITERDNKYIYTSGKSFYTRRLHLET